MHLVNVEDLQAYRSGTTTLIATGSGSGGAACASGKVCDDWANTDPYKKLWTNMFSNKLTDAKDENGELYRDKFSPALIALRQKYGAFGNFWTASDYTDNACEVFIVQTLRGLISSNPRALGRQDTICK